MSHERQGMPAWGQVLHPPSWERGDLGWEAVSGGGSGGGVPAPLWTSAASL